MASLYKYRNKYYLSYKLNNKRSTKSTYLDYNEVNRSRAETAKNKIEILEKENKLKIKYGALVPKSKDSKLRLSECSDTYLKSIKKPTANGKQDNHSRTFNVVMKQFQIDVKPETYVTDISKNDIRTFVKRKENELTNASMLTYLRYLKGFFNYLVEEEIINKSPIVKRLVPKSVSKPIITFKSEDVDSILKAAQKKSIEYYIIYKFLLLTGIRPGDIFDIRAGDFDFKSKILCIKISKTKGSVKYPIFEELTEFIDEYIPEIKKMAKEEKVFKLYSVDRIGKTFRIILKELGLKGESYNLKTFRKTFATLLADKGLQEGDLADLLDHTSTTTTRIYYKGKNAGAVRGRIEALEK